MDKVDYKKVHKALYKASSKQASIIELPKFQYVAINGTGAPNTPLFTDSIQALYAIAYTISMSYKSEVLKIKDFTPFVCPPLEGHWSVKEGTDYDGIDQSVFKWEIRIMLPDFVTEKDFDLAQSIAFNKKKLDKINDTKFIIIPSKKQCVMTHIGPFANESTTFKKMEDYAIENGFSRKSKDHNEIYLSDFRKVSEDKLKTVLTFDIT